MARFLFCIYARHYQSLYNLIFVAFFSGVQIRGVSPEKAPFFLIPGLFIGAMAWWTSLSYFVNRLKDRLRLRSIIRINQIAGILITGIGIVVFEPIDNNANRRLNIKNI
jgi:H+/Cl- antiporter ClcA